MEKVCIFIEQKYPISPFFINRRGRDRKSKLILIKRVKSRPRRHRRRRRVGRKGVYVSIYKATDRDRDKNLYNRRCGNVLLK